MNIAEYTKIASRLYAERRQKENAYSEDIYRDWYLRCSLSSLAGLEEERQADQEYKNILLDTFETCRKFIDHLDSIKPGNKNVTYLKDVCKTIATDFYMFAQQQGQDVNPHPALLPFLDTVETLRQLSYTTTGPQVAGDTSFRYRHFWNFCTVNLTAVSKMNYTEHYDKVKEAHQLTGKEGKVIPPTDAEVNSAIAFITGPLGSFMYEHFLACGPQSIQTILFFPMFDIKDTVLTPEECYTEEQRKRYIKELEALERKRDENAFTLLDRAEQSSFDVDKDKMFPADIPGAILPELVIFYKILKAILPQDRLQIETKGDNDVLLTLFPETYFVLPASQKNVRNLPVTKAVKRLVRAYASASISGKSIQLKGNKGEIIQQVSFAEATGKPSDQIINSFDISIMNCVGSLQQKNPAKRFFTDIEIAKEFNSTPDKQGHITPDSPIVQDVRESMKRLSSVYGKIDVTEQIQNELDRRHPNKSKIGRLKSGQEKLAVMQPLVRIDKIGVHTLKNDRDTLCYEITEAPPFYLHGALTRQMIQVPFEQLTSRKALTTELRLLREYTRINIEASISMQKLGMKADTITFNKILDDTYRTSADPVEDVKRIDITQVVKNIPTWKRYKLQNQILTYLDELKAQKVIKSSEVVKKKLPGKIKNIEFGFTIKI